MFHSPIYIYILFSCACALFTGAEAAEWNAATAQRVHRSAKAKLAAHRSHEHNVSVLREDAHTRVLQALFATNAQRREQAMEVLALLLYHLGQQQAMKEEKETRRDRHKYVVEEGSWGNEYRRERPYDEDMEESHRRIDKQVEKVRAEKKAEAVQLLKEAAESDGRPAKSLAETICAHTDVDQLHEWKRDRLNQCKAMGLELERWHQKMPAQCGRGDAAALCAVFAFEARAEFRALANVALRNLAELVLTEAAAMDARERQTVLRPLHTHTFHAVRLVEKEQQHEHGAFTLLSLLDGAAKLAYLRRVLPDDRHHHDDGGSPSRAHTLVVAPLKSAFNKAVQLVASSSSVDVPAQRERLNAHIEECARRWLFARNEAQRAHDRDALNVAVLLREFQLDHLLARDLGVGVVEAAQKRAAELKSANKKSDAYKAAKRQLAELEEARKQAIDDLNGMAAIKFEELLQTMEKRCKGNKDSPYAQSLSRWLNTLRAKQPQSESEPNNEMRPLLDTVLARWARDALVREAGRVVDNYAGLSAHMAADEVLEYASLLDAFPGTGAELDVEAALQNGGSADAGQRAHAWANNPEGRAQVRVQSPHITPEH